MIEIRNETNKSIYVKLCQSKLSGNMYLHIDNKKSKHINILVKPKDYEQIEPELVDA